jgi:hypothetical protein
MKNLVYFVTALHMIFLVNLAPCNAMENEIPRPLLALRTYPAVDVEGKLGSITMRIDDKNRIYGTEIEPIQLPNRVFGLNDAQIQEYEATFNKSISVDGTPLPLLAFRTYPTVDAEGKLGSITMRIDDKNRIFGTGIGPIQL